MDKSFGMFNVSAPTESFGGVKLTNVPCENNMIYGQEFMAGNFIGENERDKDGKVLTVRLFGKITKIEGNLITVMDNSTTLQTAVSLSSTSIMSSTGEIGLSSLKVDQNIVIIGEYNATNQLEARFIQAL